jgi:hypothetical protein
MPTLKQPAISKHPNGTASFYIRVKTADGSSWEACTEKPLPIADVIRSLETEYIGYMRLLDGNTRSGGEGPEPSRHDGSGVRGGLERFSSDLDAGS